MIKIISQSSYLVYKYYYLNKKLNILENIKLAIQEDNIELKNKLENKLNKLNRIYKKNLERLKNGDKNFFPFRQIYKEG